MKWMVWCHRTGHGDAEAADACARAHFESLGTSLHWPTREQIAIFDLLRNEPEKALVVFEQTFKESRNVIHVMHAAIIADTLGKTADRDRWFSIIANAVPRKTSKKTRTGFSKQIVELLRKAIPPGTVNDLDLKKIDGIIADASKVDATANLAYFVGIFLKNRGDKAKSTEYLIRSAQSVYDDNFNHILACQMLRELKVPVPPTAVESDKARK
jgi:hypothetical protein